MKEDLNKLGTEELGYLFPVIITDYDPEWEKLYIKEKKIITEVLEAETLINIHHIGSTAIPGLCAKPTIDILLIIREDSDRQSLIMNLQKIQYQFIPKPENPPPHMMFAKGYSASGITGQTFHIHARFAQASDEIVFRDYLIRNPELALLYGELKRRLAIEFKNDREKYTEGKTDFVKWILQMANCQ